MKLCEINKDQLFPPLMQQRNLIKFKLDRAKYKQDYSFKNTSIIIPIFNRPMNFNYLIKYIKQLCQSLEIVVVDASSIENSHLHKKIIERAQSERPHLNFRYHHDSNLTVIEQIRLALKMSTKKYIFRCADDDFVIFPTLATAEKMMDDEPGLAGVSGKMLRVEYDQTKGLLVTKGITGPITDELVDDRLVVSTATSHNILFSLINRKTCISAFELIEPVLASKNDHIWDRFLSLFAVTEGKFGYIDRFIQTQDNPPVSLQKIQRMENHFWYEQIILGNGDQCNIRTLLKNLEKKYSTIHGQSIPQGVLRRIIQNLLGGSLHNSGDHVSVGRQAAIAASTNGPIFVQADQGDLPDIFFGLTLSELRYREINTNQ